jgi:hypothetical protein
VRTRKYPKEKLPKRGKGAPEDVEIGPPSDVMWPSVNGSSTLGMLVEMLVEGVFLVSGVVKTVFCRFKKKVRDFFCFSPRTKGSNAGLRGKFQIAFFPYGNAENMFYNFVVIFFSSVKNGGREFLSVSIELVLYFFLP